MSYTEAYEILAAELAATRALPFESLARRVGSPRMRRVQGVSSSEYVATINVSWRDGKPGEILLDGKIFDESTRVTSRLDDVFVVQPPAPDHFRTRRYLEAMVWVAVGFAALRAGGDGYHLLPMYPPHDGFKLFLIKYVPGTAWGAALGRTVSRNRWIQLLWAAFSGFLWFVSMNALSVRQ